jgi:hypothetical protein
VGLLLIRQEADSAATDPVGRTNWRPASDGTRLKRIKDQFGKISNQMVTGINGASRKLTLAFLDLQMSGEDAVDALSRHSTALIGANEWMDRLGKSMFASSLAGGGKVWDFAEVFGGTDAMNSAVSPIMARSERLAQARKELQSSLNVLGINTLPGNNKAFRALVDQAFGSGADELAPKLTAMAPAMGLEAFGLHALRYRA